MINLIGVEECDEKITRRWSWEQESSSLALHIVTLWWQWFLLSYNSNWWWLQLVKEPFHYPYFISILIFYFHFLACTFPPPTLPMTLISQFVFSVIIVLPLCSVKWSVVIHTHHTHLSIFHYQQPVFPFLTIFVCFFFQVKFGKLFWEKKTPNFLI